jgi:hypothetical protein
VGLNFTFLDTPSLLSSAKWCSRVAMPMWYIAQPLDRRWLQWVIFHRQDATFGAAVSPRKRTSIGACRLLDQRSPSNAASTARPSSVNT